MRGHGGRVELESKPDVGTTVRLHLPAKPPDTNGNGTSVPAGEQA